MSDPGNGASGAAGLILDEAGLERVYRTYNGLVADVVAWKLSGIPEEEVEEVVSSVWAKLLAAGCGRLKGYCGRNGATFATWLSKVAKNAALDYLRSKRVAFVPLDSGQDEDRGYAPGEYLKDRSPDPLERLAAREARKEVLLAVKGLPKIYRQVVVARFYKGWGAAETAAALGIAEDTVYVRLARAFAKLRKELGRRGLDPGMPGRGPDLRPSGSASWTSGRDPGSRASGPGGPPARSLSMNGDAPHRHLTARQRLMLLDGRCLDGLPRSRIQGPGELCRDCLRALLLDAVIWQVLGWALGGAGAGRPRH